MGMGKQGQYIIKNFIPIVSENIKYEIDMDIQLSSQPAKEVDKKGFMIIQLYP